MHDYRTIKIANLLSYFYKKNMLSNIVKKSMKGLVKSFFVKSKIYVKLKLRGFRASSLSTYDFSTLFSTLPDNLIKWI